MADHLRLNIPTLVVGKRRDPYGAANKPFDRAAHATELNSVFGALEVGGKPVFPASAENTDVPDDEEEMGTVVLKFTTVGAPNKAPFAGVEMVPLGENEDNEFFVLSPLVSRQKFAEMMSEYSRDSDWSHPEAWRAALDKVRGADLYSAEDRRDASLSLLTFEGVENIDVILWPSSILSSSAARRVALERLAELRALVERASAANDRISVIDQDPRPDTLLLRVAASTDLLDELLEHPYVQRIRGPLRPFIGQGELLAAGNRAETPAAAGEGIGVVDDLVVTMNPWMKNVVAARASFPPGYAFSAATDHGTMVASIAAYGSLDAAVTEGATPRPFPILAARVSEATTGQGPSVVGNPAARFEEALTWLASEGARIAVIAFAYDHAEDEAIPSELTATIDRLARELGIVIVVSAGNIREIDPHHWIDNYPDYLKEDGARVAAPGSAALALTVGAVASRENPADTTLTAIAKAGWPSPFSRTGPTRGNRDGKTRKPEFVGPGGNWGLGPNASVPVPHDSGLGVIALTARNTPMFAATSGTSFAAPFVAHQVAKIATRYPNAGPNLLRAITALSAPPLVKEAEPKLQPRLSSAYGVPSADRVLESGMNRAVLVYEGEITVGGRVIHELPIPPEFAELAPEARRSLRIVLAFDPPVRRSRREYTGGRMHFDFVKSMSLADLKRTMGQQPSQSERERDPKLVFDPMPSGNQRPETVPGVQYASSNTLIRRDVSTSTWNVDDETYFLVVSHNRSAWTTATEPSATQNYAVAIELVDEGRPQLDLHSLAEARLRGRVRGRV